MFGCRFTIGSSGSGSEDEEDEVIKEEEVEWVLEKELQAPRPMPELLEILNVGVSVIITF